MRPWTILAAGLAGFAALGGCASISNETPPTCEGQARRPANPHGSVLLPAASDADRRPAAPRAGGRPATFGSC